ncbi:hypothetical protein EJV47_03020 [Hymenobacter gummosus]|uniref:Uncharacterized protein n=1 Tax=Hymenobacter gummosus TaxID=1776032 RepID=A0A3S0HAQ9_9BACT|nr:hypothetical protein [Hymenobacter gummosus]RTQ53722.1 hypothetical protein EJV47_03020 [Hymenobacter gummosus]
MTLPLVADPLATAAKKYHLPALNPIRIVCSTASARPMNTLRLFLLILLTALWAYCRARFDR